MKLEEVLIEMLQENTGAHMLDSGGAYGRHHERNRKLPSDVEYWDNTPEIVPSGFRYGELWGTISIYHHLKNSLEIDEETERLNAILDKYNELRPDDTYYEVLEDFIKLLQNSKRDRYKYWDFGRRDRIHRDNTYNHENSLSQDFIFTTFGDFVVIEIHNGCDARGGYTKPRIFKYHEECLFDIENYSFFCNECRSYWDKYGYNSWETDTDIEMRDVELLKYDKLDEDLQLQFDEHGCLLEREKQIFAYEGQEIMEGFDVRLSADEIPSHVIVFKDDEASCPKCNKGRLHISKYWNC
jgi:hypothetical protein